MTVLSRVLPIVVAAVVSYGQFGPVGPLHLNSSRTSLSYGGYVFKKVYDKAAESWSIQATKDGRLIRTFEDASAKSLHLYEDSGWWLSMGVIHPLGHGEGQVALKIWTGGNHCCNLYWLVAVSPEFRVLLDTSPYDFDDLEYVRDVDGDGDWEFSFGTTTYDYFGAAFAFSPEAHAWFKYDRTLRRYVAANDLCFPEIRKQIREDIARIRTHRWYNRARNAEEELVNRRQIVLNVVVQYLYAGHDPEAWSFYERNYPEVDKAQQKIYVEKRARSDPFFLAVRQRMPGGKQ